MYRMRPLIVTLASKLKRMIHVGIADDHAVIRRGIQLFISQESDMTLVMEATDGEDLRTKLAEKNMDVLLLDIDMPRMNGITAIREIRENHPELRVVILSMHPEEIYGVTARKLGASGYVSKDIDPSEVIKAIKLVMRGDDYFNENLYRKNRRGEVSAMKLSKRESEVLKLLSNGLTNKEISNQLDISEKTVSTYKIRLMNKLGAKSVVDLVNFGHRFMELED